MAIPLDLLGDPGALGSMTPVRSPDDLPDLRLPIQCEDVFQVRDPRLETTLCRLPGMRVMDADPAGVVFALQYGTGLQSEFVLLRLEDDQLTTFCVDPELADRVRRHLEDACGEGLCWLYKVRGLPLEDARRWG